jgi:hypothetical protein
MMIQRAGKARWLVWHMAANPKYTSLINKLEKATRNRQHRRVRLVGIQVKDRLAGI